MLLLIVIFVPVKEIPVVPFVLIAPFKVEVPDPALCTKELEVIAAAVTLLALTIEIALNVADPPTTPEREMEPNEPA